MHDKSWLLTDDVRLPDKARAMRSDALGDDSEIAWLVLRGREPTG
jgi:hypothetical protein